MSIFGALPAQSQRYKYDVRYLHPERMDSERGPLVLIDLARPHQIQGVTTANFCGPRRDSDGNIERGTGFLDANAFGIESLFLGRPIAVGNQTYTSSWNGRNYYNTTSIGSISHHQAHWENSSAPISDQSRSISTAYGTYADRYVGSGASYVTSTFSGYRSEGRNALTTFGKFAPNEGEGDLSNLYDLTSAELDSDIEIGRENYSAMYFSYNRQIYENIRAAQFAGPQAVKNNYIGGGQYSAIGDYYLFVLNGYHTVYGLGTTYNNVEHSAQTNRIARFRNSSAGNRYTVYGHIYDNRQSSKINKALLDNLAKRFDSYSPGYTLANSVGPTALTSAQEDDDNIILTDFKISPDGTKIFLLVNGCYIGGAYDAYRKFSKDIENPPNYGSLSMGLGSFIMSGTMAQAFNPQTISWDTDSHWLFNTDLHGWTARGGYLGKYAPGSKVNGHKSHFIRAVPGQYSGGASYAYTNWGAPKTVAEYGFNSFDMTPEGDRIFLVGSQNNRNQSHYIFQMDLNTPWDLTSYDSWQFDPRQIINDSFNHPEFAIFGITGDSENWDGSGTLSRGVSGGLYSTSTAVYSLTQDSAIMIGYSGGGRTHDSSTPNLYGPNGPLNVKWIRQNKHTSHELADDLSAVNGQSNGTPLDDIGANPKGYSALGYRSSPNQTMQNRTTIRWSHGGERLLVSTPLGVAVYRCDPNFTYNRHRRDWARNRIDYGPGAYDPYRFGTAGSEPAATGFRKTDRVFFGGHSGPSPKPRVR